MRGALERQKLRALEAYVAEGRSKLGPSFGKTPLNDLPLEALVAVEAALLDADHLAAVKLALKTKRLPFTPEDQRVREDGTRPLHERYATGVSEIPLDQYYEPYRAECDFTPDTLRLVRFLITHRRTFKECAETGINDDQQVREFVVRFEDEALLRSLFVFTRRGPYRVGVPGARAQPLVQHPRSFISRPCATSGPGWIPGSPSRPRAIPPSSRPSSRTSARRSSAACTGSTPTALARTCSAWPRRPRPRGRGRTS